jgi:hypothetical protein
MKKQREMSNIYVTAVFVLGKWKPQKGHVNKKKATKYREDLLNYDEVWNKKNTRITKYAPVK